MGKKKTKENKTKKVGQYKRWNTNDYIHGIDLYKNVKLGDEALGLWWCGISNADKWNLITDKKEAKKVKDNYYGSHVMGKEGAIEERPNITFNELPLSLIGAPKSLVVCLPPDLDRIAHFNMFYHTICGCRKSAQGDKLRIGDVVFLNGQDIKLVNEWIYYIGAYKVVKGEWRNKVGHVKALVNQVHLLVNRVAQVTSLSAIGGNSSERSKWIKAIDGKADITFIDRGPIHQQVPINRKKKPKLT